MLKPDSKAAGILLFSGDKVLLQHRDDSPKIRYPNYWCIPGGAIEANENPLEAAKRELEEETGYISKTPHFFTENTFKTVNNIMHKTYIYIEEYDNKQKIKCYEGQEFVFIGKNELDNLDIYHMHIGVIKHFFYLFENREI